MAILGTGNMAYLAAQVLRGFDPVVVARRGSTKAHLFQGLGLEVVELGELGEYMAENAPLGFDVVFEASGDPSAVNTAIEVARPRGVIHLESTPADLTPAVVKELRIVGTRCGTYREFRHAIRLKGAVKPLITSVVAGSERGPREGPPPQRGEGRPQALARSSASPTPAELHRSAGA